MARRSVPAQGVLLVLLSALAISGCGGGGANQPLSPKDEDLMRKPVGAVPMPPEALAAMQRGSAAAPAATKQTDQPVQPGMPSGAPPGPPR